MTKTADAAIVAKPQLSPKDEVRALLDRLPDVRLAKPVDSLQWRPSLWMRGLFSLPVTFTPTAAGMRAWDAPRWASPTRSEVLPGV